MPTMRALWRLLLPLPGKVLMARPDGQGCHYVLFDCAFAAAGGVRDTPLDGWPSGTAMALRAFADLEAER
jgi:hypothetical protein